MKHIILSASLMLIAISAHGQTDNRPSQPCTLKPSQAPAVRGVKLGMTVDELLTLFPASSERIKSTLSGAEAFPQFGETSFSLGPSNWENKDQYAGINEYFFRLFDGRVVWLAVRYERFPKGARWKNLDELIQRFSDSLHLPAPREWVTELGDSVKRLKCDGFQIAVSGNDEAYISFYSPSWEGTKRERLAAFEEQKRREFKP